MSVKRTIEVRSKTPPVVELDSQARAAYVRFSKAKVFETHLLESGDAIITADMSKDGNLIGLELIGVTEFTIARLLKKSGVKAPEELLRSTRYIPVKRAELVHVN